jgi:hypothetical protein
MGLGILDDPPPNIPIKCLTTVAQVVKKSQAFIKLECALSSSQEHAFYPHSESNKPTTTLGESNETSLQCHVLFLQ